MLEVYSGCWRFTLDGWGFNLNGWGFNLNGWGFNLNEIYSLQLVSLVTNETFTYLHIIK